MYGARNFFFQTSVSLLASARCNSNDANFSALPVILPPKYRLVSRNAKEASFTDPPCLWIGTRMHQCISEKKGGAVGGEAMGGEGLNRNSKWLRQFLFFYARLRRSHARQSQKGPTCLRRWKALDDFCPLYGTVGKLSTISVLCGQTD